MPDATLALEDLFLLFFVTIDDLYRELVPEAIQRRSQYRRIAFSDSEVLTLSLMQEALSIDSEASFHRFVSKNFRALFPRLISRSRYHRRRKALWAVHVQLFRHLADHLAKQAQYLIVDSAPIETVAFARSQSGQRSIPEASYGFSPSKKRYFFGLRLHALVTDEGTIFDFALTSAETGERVTCLALLDRLHSDVLLGDNGYSGAHFGRQVRRRGIEFWVSPRPSSRPATKQAARARRRLRGKRNLIESVFAMLADQFQVETTRARSTWGVMTRLVAKLLAFNLSVSMNKRLDRPPLAIKALFL